MGHAATGVNATNRTVEGSNEFERNAKFFNLMFQVGCMANSAVLLVILVALIATFVILIYKVNSNIRQLMQKIKQTRISVRDELSPTADEFLHVCAQLKVPESRVYELFTTFDGMRRKVAQHWLKHATLPHIGRTTVSQALLSESHFIKGGGFRLHRLLHEQRMPAYSDAVQGKTILAPPIDQTPMKQVKTSALDLSLKKQVKTSALDLSLKKHSKIAAPARSPVKRVKIVAEATPSGSSKHQATSTASSGKQAGKIAQ